MSCIYKILIFYIIKHFKTDWILNINFIHIVRKIPVFNWYLFHNRCNEQFQFFQRNRWLNFYHFQIIAIMRAGSCISTTRKWFVCSVFFFQTKKKIVEKHKKNDKIEDWTMCDTWSVSRPMAKANSIHRLLVACIDL